MRGVEDIMKGRFQWGSFEKLAGPLGSVTFLWKCFERQIKSVTHIVGMPF